MKTTIKAKIISVGGVLTSSSAAKTGVKQTQNITMSVVELPDNPYGHTPKEDKPFNVEVWNHNIENFSISQALVGETGTMGLMIYPTGPTAFRFVVNDLTFGV
jgi:hypothetical protein